MKTKPDIRILLVLLGVTCSLLSVLSAYQSYSDCDGNKCYHGECEGSVCSCNSCYQGDECDTPVNRYPPRFVKRTPEEVKISVNTPPGEFVAYVEAEDRDYDTTCNEQECPCANIIYSIEQVTPSSHRYGGQQPFRIDPEMGAIFTNPMGMFAPGEEYDIVVSARNEMSEADEDDKHSGDTTTVTVKVEEPLMEHDHLRGGAAPYLGEDSMQSERFDDRYGEDFGYGDIHHREKRAAPTSPNLVSNVTFTFEKTGVYENVTDIYVGSRIEFALYIQFPSGITDMLVELFTPDNDTTIMVLCDVQVTVHNTAFITMDGSTDVTYEAKDPLSYDYDRAIIDFGNVTLTGAPTQASDAMITITWSAIMIDEPSTINGTIYWNSAGAEYNSQSEIWVGQASFTAIIDMPVDITSWPTPTFNITGPDQVQVGSSHVYSVEMCIHYPTTSLSFDAFVPLNSTDAFSICNVLVTDAGDYYKCLPYHTYDDELFEADTGKGNSRGRLDIGTITNSGSRFTEVGRTYVDGEACITVEFTVFVYNDSALVGSTWWLGMAVEVGLLEIWAAQLAIEVIDQQPLPVMSQSPTFQARLVGDVNTNIGMPVIYEVDVFVPENTETEYELELLMPYNDSASQMHLCKMHIVYSGINVPCLTDTEPEYSSRDGSAVMDRGVWKLGRIRNTGQRDVAKDTDANKITVQWIANLLNHTWNNDGDKAWATFGMYYDTTSGEQMYVAQIAVVVNTSAVATGGSTPPDFTMYYAFGDENVHIDAVTDVVFEITTKAWVMHEPMEIEFILPYQDGEAIYSFCRVELTHVGKNLPCVDQAALNSSIIYTSKSNNDVYDKALLTMNTCVNVLDNTDPEDDLMRFNMKVKVRDHINITSNWISIGIKYSFTNLWVGQLQLKPIESAIAEFGGDLYLDVIRVDQPTSDDVEVARTAVYYVSVLIPAQSTGNIKITATASAGASICSIRPVEAGFNIPCFDTEKKVNITETQTFNGLEYNKIGVLDMGPITNAVDDPTWNATTNASVFGNNTIRFEVIATVLDATAQTVDLVVDAGSSALPTETLNMNGVAPVVKTTANGTIPSFDMNVASIVDGEYVDNRVVKGQAVKLHFDITPEMNTQHNLNVKFLTPVNDTGLMEICDVSVVHVGQNIPCLRKAQFEEPTQILYSSRLNSEYIDVGEVALGPVCAFPIVDTVDDPDASKIRIEAIVKVTRDSNLVVGDQVSISATVKVNQDHIFVMSYALEIIDETEFNETGFNITDANVQVNVTEPSIDMSPGEKRKIPLVVTVPPNSSSLVDIDVQTPMNDSAVMTIVGIEVVSSGENLACLATRPEVFEFNLTSSKGTTQTDRGTMSLGPVTNTGATYRSGTYEDGDNDFVVEVEVQLADAEVAIDQFEAYPSIGFKIGPTIFVIEKLVTVQRDETEGPDIVLDAQVNDTLLYDDSMTIVVDCLLYHTNLSSAEGYNVTASIYYPEYVEFHRIANNNHSIPTVTNASLENGAAVEFGSLYFTDIASFQVELKVKPNGPIPNGASLANATTQYESGSNIIYRDNHLNESGTWFASRLSSMSYRVTAQAFADDGCPPDVLPFDECQVKGPNSPDPTHGPDKVKTTGWKSAARGPGFKKYLDVNFGNVTKVSEIKVTDPGIPGASAVPAYNLHYSQDGITWQTGESITPTIGAWDPLMSPTDTRVVRVEVDDTGNQNDFFAMKLEFKGCTTLGDVLPEHVCDDSRRWGKPTTDVYNSLLVRSSMSVSGVPYSYFCDYDAYGEDSMCFSTQDGVQWRVDDTVVNVLGYYANPDGPGEMYGIAFDKRSWVYSDDDGESWFSVSKARWDEVNIMPGYVPAVEIPWIKDGANIDPSVNTKYDPSGYNTGGYGGNYNGILNGANTKVADWTQCCT